MSKTKKQVRVRTKKGKTYMRSMMVNSGSAEAISRRATQVSLKQDSTKPDKPGLISRLFFRGGKNQSKNALAAMNHDGPNAGSDHSWLAILAGMSRDRRLAHMENGEKSLPRELIMSGSLRHTENRMLVGASSLAGVYPSPGIAAWHLNNETVHRRNNTQYEAVVSAIQRNNPNMEIVPQNPNKWVR